MRQLRAPDAERRLHRLRPVRVVHVEAHRLRSGAQGLERRHRIRRRREAARADRLEDDEQQIGFLRRRMRQRVRAVDRDGRSLIEAERIGRRGIAAAYGPQRSPRVRGHEHRQRTALEAEGVDRERSVREPGHGDGREQHQRRERDDHPDTHNAAEAFAPRRPHEQSRRQSQRQKERRPGKPGLFSWSHQRGFAIPGPTRSA